VAVLWPAILLALGPHEVLLLVNEESPDSVSIGSEFARLRCVPEQNVVRLRVPVAPPGASPRISCEDFTRLIWQPAVRAAEERGIADRVLAWVYSAGFPVCIATTPELSILGLTFLRNKLPDMKLVDTGTYKSPLFAGPSVPEGNRHYSQSFDEFKEWLKDEMPLPCMMLGYTGERGNSVAAVSRCLRSGLRSDCTSPSGTVYLVTSRDVRSMCRQWEYPGTVRELQTLGVAAAIVDAFPAGQVGIMGLMMGAATVKPELVGNFRPGGMAEHLTSAAAVFDSGGQSKLSAWIDAGATASAGTVTEPISYWEKFPHSRFFVHYASGCTMIESFYQAIRCPLQILLVGDPLAQPWAPPASLVLRGADDAPDKGVIRLTAAVESKTGHYGRFLFLLDGRTVGQGPTFDLETAGLAPGAHRVRAVALRTGLVRSQVFCEKEITVGGR
jgi:uncharacterized protein (TIGR03790 family)